MLVHIGKEKVATSWLRVSGVESTSQLSLLALLLDCTATTRRLIETRIYSRGSQAAAPQRGRGVASCRRVAEFLSSLVKQA